MPTFIELNTSLKDLEKQITSMTERSEDWAEAADDIVTMLREDAKIRFNNAPPTTSGGLVYGDEYWRSLNEGYLMARPDRQSGQILVDSGSLKRSVTEDTPESLVEISENEIRFGTRLPYGERLKDEFPFVFWHPILLEKIATHLTTWYFSGNKRKQKGEA